MDALEQRVADLKIQAIMFDMDIEWETLVLVPKVKVVPEPFWLERWKIKRAESDFDELIDIDRE